MKPREVAIVGGMQNLSENQKAQIDILEKVFKECDGRKPSVSKLRKMGIQLNDPVISSYLKETFGTNEENFLSDDEFNALVIKAQAGDEKARNEIVLAYQPAIRNLVAERLKQVTTTNVLISFEDLCSLATLALPYAIEKFNREEGVKFWTYANNCVRGRINQEIYEGATIKIPRNIQQLIQRIKKQMAIFEEANHREPTAEELSVMLSVSVNRIKSAFNIMNNLNVVCIDDKTDEDFSVLETYRKDEQIEDKIIMEEEYSMLYKALHTLNEYEQRIITLRYGLKGEQPHSVKDLSIILETPFSVLRGIIQRIHNKLKHEMLKYYHAEYLDDFDFPG